MPKHLTVLNFSIFFVIQLTGFAQAYTKQETIDLYKEYYQSSELKSISWKGDVNKCICGVLPDSIYKKAQDRINFFRTMVGLPLVRNEVSLNKDCQEAALMMDANDQLSHEPAKTWKCYSTSGYNGAHSSCLGSTSFAYYPVGSFVTGCIEDIGDANYFIGHRRWLLYSHLVKFGYGATTTMEAIGTVNGCDYSEKILPDYVAYPWNGYVPYQLIFSKWSFSLPGKKMVDFSKAEVTMTDANGTKMKLEVLEIYDFLDPTIVWIPSALPGDEKYEDNRFTNSVYTKYLNKKIHISIKNVVVNGEKKNYEYYVEPIEIK